MRSCLVGSRGEHTLKCFYGQILKNSCSLDFDGLSLPLDEIGERLCNLTPRTFKNAIASKLQSVLRQPLIAICP